MSGRRCQPPDPSRHQLNFPDNVGRTFRSGFTRRVSSTGTLRVTRPIPDAPRKRWLVWCVKPPDGSTGYRFTTTLGRTLTSMTPPPHLRPLPGQHLPHWQDLTFRLGPSPGDSEN